MRSIMLQDLKAGYGFACEHATPVDGGWLNRMWRVDTNQGEVLIKQFSTERYTRERLEQIEAALQRQVLLHGNGVACPRIFMSGNRVIRLPDSETAYMVMEFSQGKTIGPDTITQAQMHSLGITCGTMHQAFAQLPVKGVHGYPIDATKAFDALLGYHQSHLRDCLSSGLSEYVGAVHAQKPILEQLSVAFLGRLTKGIAHEDFTSDNILFTEDGVSAIIDFDRNRYSYPLHDIGRALLSFALRQGSLDTILVHAFVEGYRRHLPLTPSDIADALRLSWCIETPWWVQKEFFEKDRGKATRFRDEILWLTDHWFQIDDLLAA